MTLSNQTSRCICKCIRILNILYIKVAFQSPLRNSILVYAYYTQVPNTSFVPISYCGLWPQHIVVLHACILCLQTKFQKLCMEIYQFSYKSFSTFCKKQLQSPPLSYLSSVMRFPTMWYVRPANA